MLLRTHVAFARHGPRVLVFHFGAALLELPDGHAGCLPADPGLEAGDHDRHVVARGDRLVFAIAHDRAHVPRTEEALHAIVGRLQDAGDRRRHDHVRDQHGEIAEPCALACNTAMALAGAVVSKPMAKNTTFLSGFACAIFRQSSGE